jgi:mono/diheme cytochrome c family protein
VLITGITAFMLNPGAWATSTGSAHDFWTAFLNPQFLPQTIARTGGALLLSSLYVYLHASLMIRDAKLRDMIASRSARPALLGAVLITIGGIGWHYFLPPSAEAALESAAPLNILIALIFVLTIVVFFLLYLGPYKNPGWLSPGFAGSLCLFGIAAFSTGEFIREAVRKPFVVYNVVLANQILPEEVQKLQAEGYLNGGTWTKQYVKDTYPAVIVNGRINGDALLDLPHEDRVALGKVIFQYHCNDCHASVLGYSAVAPLLRGRSREMIRSTIQHLDGILFMPPWCGTLQESELITDYLMSIVQPRPAGMLIGVADREVK